MMRSGNCPVERDEQSQKNNLTNVVSKANQKFHKYIERTQ